MISAPPYTLSDSITSMAASSTDLTVRTTGTPSRCSSCTMNDPGVTDSRIMPSR